jgi:lipopolysaccharide export system protein LptC
LAQVNRYSTLVSWAKVILPLLALALMSTLFLFSRAPNPDAALPFAEVDVEQIAREQRLTQPRFAGTLVDGREVTLVAREAAPASSNPNLIALSVVEGRVELPGDNFLVLNARDGALDMGEQFADLQGDVRIVTSQGYRLISDAMQVSLSAFRLVSPGEVTASGPGFDLTAGAMDVSGEDDETVLSFTGGVRLLYDVQQ